MSIEESNDKSKEVCMAQIQINFLYWVDFSKPMLIVRITILQEWKQSKMNGMYEKSQIFIFDNLERNSFEK